MNVNIEPIISMMKIIHFMKVKQEEIKIKVPSTVLKKIDYLVYNGWFDNRDDLICYTIRKYTDEMERIETLNKEYKKLKKQFNE